MWLEGLGWVIFAFVSLIALAFILVGMLIGWYLF